MILEDVNSEVVLLFQTKQYNNVMENPKPAARVAGRREDVWYLKTSSY